jgi:hypothetical protein
VTAAPAATISFLLRALLNSPTPSMYEDERRMVLPLALSANLLKDALTLPFKREREVEGERLGERKKERETQRDRDREMEEERKSDI